MSGITPGSHRFVQFQERYLRDAVPVRLGNLASNLARLAACVRTPVPSAAVPLLLQESVCFIEWTATQTAPRIQPELVRLQVELARWRLRWERGETTPADRERLAAFAAERSRQVLEWSGLLEEGRQSAD